MGAFVHRSIVLAALLVLVPVGAGLESEMPESLVDAGVRREMLSTAGLVDRREFVEPEHLPAPTASTGIGPGSRIYVTHYEGEFLCSANFIWNDGTNLYLGTAGHCIVPSDRTATHGPGADYNAAGSIVRVCVSGCNFGGQSAFILEGTTVLLGPASYGRQTLGGVDVGNDFGLIRIPPSLYPQVRTSMPVWGGPTSGTNPTSIDGKPICQYGHGMIVGETYLTQAKVGVGMNVNAGAGSFQYLLGGMPGDSGSPAVMCATDGGGLHGAAALGIHTHSSIAYTPVKLGTTIAKAKAMTARDFGKTINVALGS